MLAIGFFVIQCFDSPQLSCLVITVRHPVVKSGFTRVLIKEVKPLHPVVLFQMILDFTSFCEIFFISWRIHAACLIQVQRYKNCKHIPCTQHFYGIFYCLNFHFSFWNCICQFLFSEMMQKIKRRFLNISGNLRPHNSLKFQMEKKLKCQVEIQKKIKLCLLTKNIYRVKTINLRIKNREK